MGPLAELLPSSYTNTHVCMLTRLTIRGPSDGNSEEPASGMKAVPFPAMTTDSRHIILVYPAGKTKDLEGGVEEWMAGLPGEEDEASQSR